jgi:hypothetical protein
MTTIFREKLAREAALFRKCLRSLDEQEAIIFVKSIFDEADLVFGVWDHPQHLGCRLIKGRKLLGQETSAAVQDGAPLRVRVLPCFDEKHAVATEEIFAEVL